jgi:DNA-binding transcriptional MerR regulator
VSAEEIHNHAAGSSADGAPAGEDTADDLLSITQVAAAFRIPVSTLRYYDEIGLVPASHRRSRVRHYNRAALTQLAYVQLWHVDGSLGIEQTTAIVASMNRAQRNDVLERSRREMADRIARLREAHDMLLHAARCPHDDHDSCPVITAYLDNRVRGALDHLAGRAGPERSPAGPELLQLVERLVRPSDRVVPDQHPGTGPEE